MDQIMSHIYKLKCWVTLGITYYSVLIMALQMYWTTEHLETSVCGVRARYVFRGFGGTKDLQCTDNIEVDKGVDDGHISCVNIDKFNI